MKRLRTKKEDSGGNIPSIDVLHHHILPRLPVKSLFRCKCVCRSWHALISEDPIFRERQSQIFKPSSGLLYWENRKLILFSTDGDSMSVPDPYLRFLGNYVSVANSCNGLICGFYVREDLYPEIYVCNPVTQEVRSISNPKRRHIVGLAFDPSVPKARYELVCPYRILSSPDMEYGFDLFSSSTGVWRESKEKIIISCKNVTGRSYFVGGILYFRAQNDVVWFHPEEDLAGVTKLPIADEMTCSIIGVYGSSLCYTQLTFRDVEIWTLNGNNWDRRHCIILDFIDIFGRSIPNFKSMEYWIERRIDRRLKLLPLVLPGCFLFQMGETVHFYRIGASEMLLFPSDSEGKENCLCVPYINSLVSLPN